MMVRVRPSVVRRTLGYVALACIVVFGLVRCAEWVWLPHYGRRVVIGVWNVVAIAPDRRSAVIRVEMCAAKYSGTKVDRVGRDVRFTVYQRLEPGVQAACVDFDGMPTFTVKLGAPLAGAGRILGGCARNHCA
jgi:hypothetical protein